MTDFYSNDCWLSVPVSRGRSAIAWRENSWTPWLGGYAQWAKDKPPEFNSWRFVRDCEELERATMLEF